MICKGIKAEELLAKMRAVIEAEPLAKIDYVSMVDALTMQPVEKADKRCSGSNGSLYRKNKTDRQLQLRGIIYGKCLKKMGKSAALHPDILESLSSAFLCLAFFWRDGFAWTTNYTSVFLGVAMFGMGLTIKMDDFSESFFQTKRNRDRICCTVYDHACCRMGIV